MAEPVFLGISDHSEPKSEAFMAGPLDFFQLSPIKRHFVFPAIINSNDWVFFLSKDFLSKAGNKTWKIDVEKDSKKTLGHIKFQTKRKLRLKGINSKFIKASDLGFFLKFSIQDVVVEGPGEYKIYFSFEKKRKLIGKAFFEYSKMPKLTIDQVRAIESNPLHISMITLKLGCKHCPKTMVIYTAFKRHPEKEISEGWLWYDDVKGKFKCDCGKSCYSLKYIQESMHGFLLKSQDGDVSGLSYIRRYGHEQIVKVIDRFRKLLESEKLEKPVQKFLEENPILLSVFQASRFYIKPKILGKHIGDFAILDSRNQLWLIEIEKPSLNLFNKKTGHPTQGLAHAYEQVNDWIYEYAKHRHAVIDGLKLQKEKVSAVRGAVIAGRRSDVKEEHIERHMSQRSHKDIEFMTFDDLCRSLMNISKKLA